MVKIFAQANGFAIVLSLLKSETGAVYMSKKSDKSAGWVSFDPDLKIVDCTVRDGGLINNHNFEEGFFKKVYDTCVAGGIDYMETCLANHNMCKEQKEELRLIVITAMAGYGDFYGKTMPDIIANADDLF